MKIIALLSWYDESPTWLSTCVAGIGRFCDEVIAVDGAYALYPGGRARSHPQQVEAITLAAETAGIGCMVYQPSEKWAGNELEKRNKCLDLAASIAEDGDWVAVIDADYHLLKCEPEVIRVELANCEEDVAAYILLEGKDFASSGTLEQFAAARNVDHEWVYATRDLYRWNPTLRVGPAHWCYSAELDGERRWLRGPYDLEPHFSLNRNLVFYHRTADRYDVRRRAADKYYELRDTFSIETTELVA